MCFLSENIRVVGLAAMLGNIAFLGPQRSESRPRLFAVVGQTYVLVKPLETIGS